MREIAAVGTKFTAPDGTSVWRWTLLRCSPTLADEDVEAYVADMLPGIPPARTAPYPGSWGRWQPQVKRVGSRILVKQYHYMDV